MGTVIEGLRELPLFEELPEGQLENLGREAVRRSLRPREVLYEQGAEASSCFLVLDGTVRMSVQLGRQAATSGLAYANDIVGLEALLNRAPRQETAVAGTHVDLLEVRGRWLASFLVDNPAFLFELLRHVIAGLYDASSHAVQTGHYDAEQRIAAYLVDHCVVRRGEAREAPAAISQADLADYLALTPETLCRKVSKFRKLGWIGGRGNEFVVKQPGALQDLLEQ
jgi:CRP/FNR family transcriptional regulator